jgi:formate hydrogenlyase transcriptional activator
MESSQHLLECFAMSEQQFSAPEVAAVRHQYQTLLTITESIASHRDLSELFHDLAQSLGNILQFDYLSMRRHDPQGNVMRRRILERSSPVELDDELPVDGSRGGWVWENQQRCSSHCKKVDGYC